ncbi:MAG: SEC-C metal-binding domain-containing protein [Armatimonadota bacterium]|nr:SEC-C domain-containing protein [Fimbriimonadaceae bacterium]
MTASVDPLGNRTSYAYDNAGNQTSVTNPLGFITTSVYSANSNRMSASVDPLGNRTTYSYDLAGQQTSRQDARGNRITYSYDLAGRQIALRPCGSGKKFKACHYADLRAKGVI